MGRRRFNKFVDWAMSWPKDAVRAGSFAGILFGAFLIYGLW